MSAQWHRIDSAEAPQGHALARDWGESTFVAYEQPDGTWKAWREDASGVSSEPVVLSEFADVRKNVEEAVVTYKRMSNPKKSSSKKGEHNYLRAGISAVVGTTIGMLLGGLPGIFAGHTPLTIVGTQVGGVLGAAGGALYAESRDNNPEPAHVNVRALKNKLLR